MSESPTVADPSILANQEPAMTNDVKAAVGEHESMEDRIKKLEEDLQLRTEEKENYKNRLQAAEREIAILKVTAASQAADAEDTLLDKLREDNNGLREALNKAAELIQDKTNLCLSQERQNAALTHQVTSMKEVVAITKDLLNIRNMEVKHLQSEVDSMEGKIKKERERQRAMISKMDQAATLNAELKTEYENQFKIFQDLKERYELKVHLLEEENRRLEVPAAKTETVCNNENEGNKPTDEQQECKPEDSEVIDMPNNRSSDRKMVKRSDSTNSDEFVDAHEDVAGN